MKTTVAIGALVVALGNACPSPAQTLDDAAVAAALQAGVTKKYNNLVAECIAGSGFGAGLAANMAGGVQPTGGFDVIVSRAAGRIAYLAADSKRLYKSFTLADVTPELRDNSMVFVTVNPQKPGRANSSSAYEVPSPIERVVLKSKTNPNSVAQPGDIQLTPQEWSNLMGGKIQGNSAVATFKATDIGELPPGDIDVVVITQAGERRCKLGAKDRALILGK